MNIFLINASLSIHLFIYLFIICLSIKAFINTYKQKNEDFKKLFKLPPDEHLLVDYSCALQREILAHGRLYISLNYVCFRANIIGWETTVRFIIFH